MDPYVTSTPNSTKLPILDTGKFEQWKFRIQQYLQHEHYALWEVIEFGDSYRAPAQDKSISSEATPSSRSKGRTMDVTVKDMQKRRNDVKARTTLLLDILDEHQLRFSNPTASVPTASSQVSTVSTEVAAASLSHDTICAYIATQSSGSQIKYEDITQIDEDDIEEMDIKWNLALLSMRADRFWKKLYMANEDENHALVADDVVPTEFALMAMSSSSSSSDNESLERDVEIRDNKIKSLKNELEELKKEKESIDHKLAGFGNASKDLNDLLESQKSAKDKTGVGFNEYSVVPPPPTQVYLPPKKDLSWTGLPSYDDTFDLIIVGHT
ncbi:hypothetical protein Tco_1063706 [Tanacetum coccineum]